MREYLRGLRNSAFEDTITTTDVIFRSLAQGQRYTLTHLFEGVDETETVRVFAELPSEAENPITVGTRQISASGGVKGEAFGGVSVDTEGTEIEARNDKFSPSGVPETEANWSIGGEYGNKTDPISIFVPGGRTGQRPGGTGLAAFGYAEPGVNLLWELSPVSNDTDILFKVIYSEAPEVSINE